MSDCDTADSETKESFLEVGLTFKALRRGMGVLLRKFCKENHLDAVTISRLETGMLFKDDYVKAAGYNPFEEKRERIVCPLRNREECVHAKHCFLPAPGQAPFSIIMDKTIAVRSCERAETKKECKPNEISEKLDRLLAIIDPPPPRRLTDEEMKRKREEWDRLAQEEAELIESWEQEE